MKSRISITAGKRSAACGDEVTTQKGKKFKLLNLPFYYVGVLEEVLKKHAA